jgi:hypothetical protein
MVSEKIQEVENYLNTLTKDIDDFYSNIVSLTKTFIDDLGKMFDIDTKEIYIDNYYGDVVFRHRSSGIAIGDVMISNYLFQGFSFRGMNLVVDHSNSSLQNDAYRFSINQMIYEAVKNKSDVFLIYQNNVNEHLVSVLSKKQLSKTLEWVYNLLKEVDRETKQEEIFYKGHFHGPNIIYVQSFDYKEVGVYGLSFTKNTTGTYSIQLLNNDKTIKAQSSRASEETLRNLIKYFV